MKDTGAREELSSVNQNSVSNMIYSNINYDLQNNMDIFESLLIKMNPVKRYHRTLADPQKKKKKAL